MPKASSPKSTTSARRSAASSSTPAPYRFGFGMHRGKLVSEVPSDYLQWCRKEGIIDRNPALRAAVAALGPTVNHPQPDMTTRMANLERQFPPWLWKACNEYIDVRFAQDVYGMTSISREQKEREVMLELAVHHPSLPRRFIREFPARPDNPLAPSASIDKLREVVARAPKRPSDESKLFETKGLDADFDGFTGDLIVEWSADYTKEVCAALVDVIKEHGLAGWRNVRWEIRDKYAENMAGVSLYNDGRHKWWVDHADGWLRGRDGFAAADAELRALLPAGL